MNDTGLIEKSRLGDEDMAQIRELAAACESADGLQLKFNWEQMLERDRAHVQDFCWYDGGRCVGYVQIDGVGAEVEVTGAVLPAYRNQGIGRRLFEAARSEAQRQGVQAMLLVTYPHCPAGTEAARRLGTTYRCSEYHMEAEADAIPPLHASALELEEVTTDDISALSRTAGLSLGGGRWHEPEALCQALRQPGQRFFVARVGAEAVGQIGAVVSPEGDIYLRAVGILPEWRRQGLGRRMLAATVHRLMTEGHRRFALDVETCNAQALSLYQECGFRETMVYDYWDVPLT